MPNIITLICEFCNNEFPRELRFHNQSLNRNAAHIFCSNQCRAEYQKKSQKMNCSFCGQETIKTFSEIQKNKTGRFFCSKSHAAKYNNHDKPKRIMRQQECDLCGNTYQTKHKTIQCPTCQKLAWTDDSTTVAEAMFTKSETMLTKQSKYSKIRDHAQRVMKDIPKICALTGYDKHVQICHILPIHKFSLETPLSIVDDKRNLILLSPNAHWEVDHGITKLPENKEFDEYYKIASEYFKT
jgi:hypothetical protein